MKKLDNILEKIENLETEIDDIYSKLTPLQKAATAKNTKLRTLREKRDEIILSNRIDSGEVDLDLILCGDPETKAMYNEKEKQLRQLYLISSGYFPETGQSCIQIALTRGDTKYTEKVYRSLKLVVPHLKKFKTNNLGDRVILDIFEHTCSEFASYKLYLDEPSVDSPCCIVTNGRREGKRFKDLREALTYIQKEHWYNDVDKL